jgi:hypothetical protein
MPSKPFKAKGPWQMKRVFELDFLNIAGILTGKFYEFI